MQKVITINLNGNAYFATAVTLFFIWVLYRHMPPTHDAREFMQHLPDAFRAVGEEIGTWARTLVQDLK